MCDRSVESRTSSTPRCGRRARVRGKTAVGTARTAASSNRPTAARPGSQLRKGLPRAGRSQAASASPSRRASPQRLFAAVATRTRDGLYRSDDGGENWTVIDDRTRAPAGRSAAAISPRSRVDPKNPDVVYTAQHRHAGNPPTAARRGSAFAARPGGDDYQNIWINPEQPGRSSCSACDQGAIITVNGGETWSSWYNQPTAQLYHVSADNAFPVPRVQRTAGKRIGVRRQPRQRRRRSLSATGIRSASKNTATSRPIRSIRTSSTAASSRAYDRRTGAGAGHRAEAACRARVSHRPDAAGGLLAGRSARSVLRRQHAVEDDRTAGRSWEQISPDLTRKTLDSSGDRRQIPRAADGGIHAARRHLHGRAVAPRHQPHLGGHGRRPDSRHDRRRQELEGRHAAAADAVAESLDHRRQSLRIRTALRRGQYAPARRSAPAHLPHARRRRDLDRDHQRHPGRRDRQRRCAKIRQRKGLLFAGTEHAGLCFVRRRRSLAVAAAEHAGDFGARSDDQRRRPRRGDARPGLLDPGRHHAAAAARIACC